MPKYRVNLNRATIDNCDVVVFADNALEARDLAIDEDIGNHEWENQETLDISVGSCEEIDDAATKP